MTKCERVLGGFDNTRRGVLYTGPVESIRKETERILADAGETGIMLGADCSIPSDIS